MISREKTLTGVVNQSISQGLCDVALATNFQETPLESSGILKDEDGACDNGDLVHSVPKRR
jgi:hypothetical protein